MARQLLTDLLANFIATGSSKEINIDHDLRQNLLQQVPRKSQLNGWEFDTTLRKLLRETLNDLAPRVLEQKAELQLQMVKYVKSLLKSLVDRDQAMVEYELND